LPQRSGTSFHVDSVVIILEINLLFAEKLPMAACLSRIGESRVKQCDQKNEREQNGFHRASI
jgi:hypothetical protein